MATILAAAAALVGHTPEPAPAPSSAKVLTETEEREGMAPRPAYELAPAVAATFLRDGYRPGQVASLVLWRPERHFTVQFFRASQMHTPKWRTITMQGIPVTRVRTIKGLPAHTPLRFRIGNWRSGVYFARLRTKGRTGFAPFVVRPSRLGEHDVLVVEPTFTWQAYNFRDDDHDGIGDTWYADHNQTSINLVRPFLSRGMPPHFPIYDLPFLNWLEKTGKRVDFMSDSQFATVRSARALAHAYRLIIFPGHHEYVTKREYNLSVGYRNRGGHLMFLSADNFYWKVVRHGDTLVRTAAWRTLGRPEAALIGVAFIRNDGGRHQGRWTVRNTRRYPWLFGDTRLRVGSSFGHGGIEIDHTNSASPPGTTVIADMRNLMGPGVTAQMSYYQTPRGAEVFAAGAFTLGGARNPVSRHIIQHVWDHLTRPKGVVTPQRGRGLASLRRAARVRPTYGYPVKPFHRQHPVRGVFGDPRIDLASTGVKRQFHFGVDVSAPNGTPVYSTISGTIALHPLHNDVVLVDAPNGVEFSYWHIVPTVRGGEHATAYRTMIGRIERPWAHVHFSEARWGRYLNPLRPGAMGPYLDRHAPTITAVEVERRGSAIQKTRVSGTVNLIAEVFDSPAAAVPPPWAGLPVMPALIRWRIIGPARAVTRWSTAVDFRREIPAASAFGHVYARWTRQNHAKQPGRYRVYLAHGWRSGSVPDGLYHVEVRATDVRANTARFSAALDVVNGLARGRG